MVLLFFYVPGLRLGGLGCPGGWRGGYRAGRRIIAGLLAPMGSWGGNLLFYPEDHQLVPGIAGAGELPAGR